MPSKKKNSMFFEMLMSILVFIFFTLLFFGLKNDKDSVRVKKHVTMAEVVVKKEVASRVIRDSVVDSKANGPVTVKLDFNDLSFDLKNSK